ncbi:MAG: hypothetical protein J7501_06170, partial [Bdellovibrio sp.]|nr:hypothetical protein [Bdellovibrio sp.]
GLMKFNDNHKKWAMTGVLLAVLGFNVSINTSKPVFEMNSDFASRTTSRTEGASKEECEKCLELKPDSGFERNKSDIIDVSELISDLAEKHKTVKADIDDEDEDRDTRSTRRTRSAKEDDEDDRPRRTKKIALEQSELEDALMEKIDQCESARRSRDGQLDCMSSTLVSFMKKYPGFSDKLLVDTLQDRFMPIMSEKLESIREDALATDQFSPSYLRRETVDALKPLAEIVAAVPSDKRALKADLVSVEKELSSATIKKVAELNDTLRSSSQDPLSAQSTSMELRNRLMELQQWGQYYQIAQIVPNGLARADQNASFLQQNINQMTSQVLGMNYTMNPNGMITWSDGTTTGINGTMGTITGTGMPVQGVGGILAAPGAVGTGVATTPLGTSGFIPTSSGFGQTTLPLGTQRVTPGYVPATGTISLIPQTGRGF